MPVELPVPHEAPINFLSGALFFKNKFGLGGKKNIFQTTFLKNNKFFPIYVYQKGGPNFTISPIPAFVGHLLQIFWPYTNEAQANYPNVLAKKILLIFAGGQAW